MVGRSRILYVAQLADVVVVLHAFEKKAQKTPKRELNLANYRLRAFAAIQTKEKKR